MHSIIDLHFQLKELMKKYEVNSASFAIIKGDIVIGNTILDANAPFVDQSMSDDSKITSTKSSLFSSTLSDYKNNLLQGCSFSKCIMSFCIMLLIQQEKIGLDDRVAEKLISWKLPKCCDQSITIRQCLALTSGLAYEATATSNDPYLQTDPIPSLRDVLEGHEPSKTGKIYSQYPAGSYYSYSGAGYMLLQQLVEDLTQQTYLEYVNKAIFEPLGLRESTLACPLPTMEQSSVIPGYGTDGKQNSDGWYNVPYAASGGLWTTAKEMALFMREVIYAFNGRSAVLYNQSLAIEMLTSQSDGAFGLGFSVDSGPNYNVRKQAYNQGYYNQLIVCPESNYGIVVMTNSAAAKPLIAEFIEYYMDGNPYNPDFDEVKTVPLSSPELGLDELERVASPIVPKV